MIENAVKYTSRGDTILLSCSLDKTASQLKFSVRDSGVGIPADKIETIFNPFYQVDVGNKKALHGSGIGLSISKAYIEMLGGELVLESELEKGTNFHFYIALDS